jgi:hypothetical protein
MRTSYSLHMLHYAIISEIHHKLQYDIIYACYTLSTKHISYDPRRIILIACYIAHWRASTLGCYSCKHIGVRVVYVDEALIETA